MTVKMRRGSYFIMILALLSIRLPAQTAGDHLKKANEYLQANEPDAAAKEFQSVLAMNPRSAEAYANLGVIAFFHRDYVNAATDLQKALEIDPSLTKTQALLGISKRRLGHSSAQPLLEKSFPLLKDKNLQIEAGLELANIYYQQGNLDSAATIMRSLVDIDPDNIEILYMAQRVYSDLADDTLNKLAMLAPGSARMQQEIAQHLINQGDLKGATEHYRKALQMNPRLPGVHFELAEAILESAPNDPEVQLDAERELKAAVQMDGASARTECMFARIASRRSDLDSASAHYSRAIALNPGDTEAQIGIGRLLTTQGKPGEAVKYLRMAVQSDPLNEDAHYRLAIVCKKLELQNESENELRLFQEIKEAKQRLRELYGQMNRRPPGQEELLPDAEP